jgi:hypothetical protein
MEAKMANGKKATRKSKKSDVVEATSVVVVEEKMPDLETLEVAPEIKSEKSGKGLYLNIIGDARRLMLIFNRSLFGIFPTVVWVVSELRNQALLAFDEYDAGEKTGVNLSSAEVMEVIIRNATEASESRTATREDVERELAILHAKLAWYDEKGFNASLALDGFRAEMNEVAEALASAEDGSFRRLQLDAAALIDELEEASFDKLEESITYILGAERAIPKITKIWENARHAGEAKMALADLRKEAKANKAQMDAVKANKARCTASPERPANRDSRPARPAFQVHL